MIAFITESIKELLYEVTWPPYQELNKLSLLFLIALFINASLVGCINIYLQKVITALYSAF